MKRMFTILLSLPLTLLGGVLFVFGLAWSFALYQMPIEVLSEGLEPVVMTFFGYIRRASMGALTGGACVLLLSLIRGRTFSESAGWIGTSPGAGLTAVILLVQSCFAIWFALPLAQMIQETISQISMIETALQGAALGPNGLLPVAVLFWGTGMTALTSLVFVIGGIIPFLYVIFNLGSAPRVFLLSLCLQLTCWLTLYYCQDVLELGKQPPGMASVLDCLPIDWFSSRASVIAGTIGKLAWLLPGSCISAGVVLLQALNKTSSPVTLVGEKRPRNSHETL